MEYFNKEKYKMFPEIKDFSDPQNKWRTMGNVNKMQWKYWFWFHPSAYNFIFFGYPLQACVIFTVVGRVIMRNVPVFGWILYILAIIMLIAFISRLKQRRLLPDDYNFYDLYLREYSGLK